jgi:hypothetical protein
MGKDNKLRCFVTINEAQKICWELHEDFGIGHFKVNIIVKKILNVGY